MKNLISFIVFMYLFTGCTDDRAASKTPQSAGYKDVKFTGYSMFACGKDDTFSSGFEATNPVGQRVSGTVCCGWLKSCTIRF